MAVPYGLIALLSGSNFWQIPLIFFAVIIFIGVSFWNFWRWFILLWLNQASEADLNRLPSLVDKPEIIKWIITECQKEKFNELERIKT